MHDSMEWNQWILSFQFTAVCPTEDLPEQIIYIPLWLTNFYKTPGDINCISNIQAAMTNACNKNYIYLNTNL